MTQQPSQKPNLEIQFTNSFGYKTKVITDVENDTLDALMLSIADALKAFGFSNKSIEEYIPAP